MGLSKISNHGVDLYKIKVNPGGQLVLDTDGGEVVIVGDLRVLGNTTTVEAENLEISDNVLTLNSGEIGPGVSLTVSGMKIDRGTGDFTGKIAGDALFFFNEDLSWFDSQSSSIKTGAFEFVSESTGQTFGIFTNSISTSGNNDLVLMGSSSTGLVTVTGSGEYEKRIFPYTGNNITANSLQANGLAAPNDSDAVPNVQLLMDYVRDYHSYNYQSKISSPKPDGHTEVEVFSTEEGDANNRALVTINSTEVLEIFDTGINVKKDITSSLSTFNLLNSNVTTVNAFGDATDVTVGSSSGTVSISNDLSVNNNIDVIGLTASGDVAVNGSDITTTASTFNLLNTNATTVNFAGAGTTITIGAVSGATTVRNNLTVTGNIQVTAPSAIISSKFDNGTIDNSVFQNGTVRDSVIILKNTDTEDYVPTVSDIDLAELYVNNTDGKVYFKRTKDSTTTIREIGLADRVSNVYYVSENGSNDNNGTTLAESFSTIDQALATIQALRVSQNEDDYTQITIFVKSGSYSIDNPVRVPARVGIVGDNLRTVTIRPENPTLDMFWLYNGAYLTHMTFKGHLSPASAVAFPTDGDAGSIKQSPYVQNCTSITTTGTGMRVDGDHVEGLKSMVVDAYTQYNQGGIGIHMLNRGNTQLVSVFTICCDIGFLCEAGGFCSITNSNSSFGNFGIKADGISTALYSARVVSQTALNQFTLDRLVKKPNIGDAIKVGSDDSVYYTVLSVGDLEIGNDDIELAVFENEAQALKDAKSLILGAKTLVQTETIRFLNREYPFFLYNEAKCSRDVGIIVEAIVDDMVLGTNYKSIKSGSSYLRANAASVISGQLEETVAAMEFAKAYVLSLLTSPSTAYTRISNNFDIVLGYLENPAVTATLSLPNPTGVDTNRENAKNILQANRQFLIEEGIAYIDVNYPSLTYSETACRRDIGLIVDAISYDMLYQGNSQSTDAAKTYFNGGISQLDVGEIQPTIDTFEYLRTVARLCVVNSVVSELNSEEAQDTSLPAASATEQAIVDDLFDIVTTLIDDRFTCIVTIEEEVAAGIIPVASELTFHQLSLISASGHTFEWIGAGTNVNTALPYLGGTPITENQVIEVSGGRVYYTSTDQRGDFKIGSGITINRAQGTIEGRVFRRSLYSILTPYILALGE